MSEILFACTIPGRPYVKKNNQRAVGSGRFKRILYSHNFVAWESRARAVVSRERHNWPRLPIDFEVNLACVFGFENRQAEADTSALYEGPQDVLEKMGVIVNDKLIVSHDGSRKVFGVDRPFCAVRITRATDFDLWGEP